MMAEVVAIDANANIELSQNQENNNVNGGTDLSLQRLMPKATKNAKAEQIEVRPTAMAKTMTSFTTNKADLLSNNHKGLN